MFGSLLSVFAASLALANAYTTPVGNPTGNPISRPGLDEQVPAGQPYTITWTPTTVDTITLLLLRGPSTNVVPIATLADGIQNTGTFVWTPSTSLQPDTTGYGLQLICDDTGEYQYSTQFGVSNPNYSSSNSTSASASGSGYSGNSTASITTSSASYASTGMPVNSSSIVSPTKSMSVPSTLLSTSTATTKAATSSASATSTGAAPTMGLSIGGAVAALAVAVAAL